MIVHVTWDDIELGKQGRGYECPVALAYKREYGRQCYVSSDGWLDVQLEHEIEVYQLGQAATTAIKVYDQWGIMQPMEVELYRSRASD